MAHWSSGQDASLSRWKLGFDSRMGHQKSKQHIARCAVCFFGYLSTELHGICARAICSGSHTPPEDRGARSPGAGGGYIRRRRNSRYSLTSQGVLLLFLRFLTESHGICALRKCSGSHTLPEDRQARLSGAGCGYIRATREIPGLIYTSYEVLFSFFGDPSAREYGARNSRINNRCSVLFLFPALQIILDMHHCVHRGKNKHRYEQAD